MVDIEFARNEVKMMYKHNRDWAKKVDRMPDNQVLAIYFKEVNKPKKKPKSESDNDDIPF